MPYGTDEYGISHLSIDEESASILPNPAEPPDRVRIKNRRKRYLDLHPEYFSASNLESAGCPHSMRLVRLFQSAQEREDEGRRRGYSGMLEAGLIRSEAKVYNLRHPDPSNPLAYQRGPDGSIVAVENDIEDRVKDKEEGLERWKDIMSRRFVSGDDRDFDYSSVDSNEAYDDLVEEERRKQETYFDKEEVSFVGNGDPTGETGIQDF